MTFGHAGGIGEDELVKFKGLVVLWDQPGYYYDHATARESRGAIYVESHNVNAVTAMMQEGEHATLRLNSNCVTESAALFDTAMSVLLNGPVGGAARVLVILDDASEFIKASSTLDTIALVGRANGVALHLRFPSLGSFARLPQSQMAMLASNTINSLIDRT